MLQEKCMRVRFQFSLGSYHCYLKKQNQVNFKDERGNMPRE